MTPAIRAQSLTRRFGDLTVVDGLTLEVQGGEIFGLVGPDGAGKTTTMRLLTAILDPSAGSAQVDGLDIVKDAEPLKERIGYMSQRFGLYADLTVMENIHFYADIYGVPHKGRSESIDRLLAFSNLTPFKKRLAGNLSGGMKQKLGLACALVHTPRVLFLDEPTNGVDPVSRRDFWRILYQLLAQGVTIFVSTAYLDEAERCNHLGLIHKGRLLAAGTPDQIKQHMRGAILDIRTAHPRGAIDLLRREMPDLPAGLFGSRIHVVSERPEVQGPQIADLIVRNGLGSPDIASVDPSLEDVFISIVRQQEAEDQGREAPGNAGGYPPAVRGASNDQYLGKQDAAIPHVESAPNAPPSVIVKDLVKRFGSFTAVDRVSFEVPQGEIFGFLGPNGAGKSTTIRMLCGILAPSDGDASVAGLDVRTQPEQIKANIGYMSQKFSLYEDLTVEENIDFYSGIYRIDPGRKQARKDWVIRMAGLEERRHSPAGILSGGWKQRLALGCAILHEPPIIFLDEPTSGVDPISRRQFWDLIYEMAGRGVTVFVTTHYMDEAEYCDRVALIYRGRLAAIGTPEQLKTQQMTEDVLEIQCPQPHLLLGRIEKLPQVKEAALFGKGLHAVVRDPRQARAAIEAFLLAEGFAAGRDFRIEKIVPSLEDVFVSLIESRDREESPQAQVRS